jgi:predicted nucleic acid-binding protein
VRPVLIDTNAYAAFMLGVELSRFLESPRVEVLPITGLTAESYALVYAALRRKGQPIPTNDLCRSRS